MARPNIPAAVLASRGVPISLQDGSSVDVCYTFHSLMLLEERFGSLSNALAIIGDPKAAQFSSIAGILACGLEHAVASPDMDGAPLSNVDVLGYLLDPTKISDYATAMGEAFSKSFPAAVEQTGGQEDTDPPSPGASGTTSDESPSASPMQSSGV